MQRFGWVLALCAVLMLSGCGYNEYQRLDERTKASWSEVINQYQRRADLIPNLEAVVERQANFESSTLKEVIEARARATAIHVTPETLNDPQAMAQYQQAQAQLGSALARLMAVAEAYPNLQANQAFRDLAVSLEGTENRIGVARNQYIQAVQEYNVLRRSFPSNITGMIMGYHEKPAYTVADEQSIATPPKISMPASRTTEGRPLPSPQPTPQ